MYGATHVVATEGHSRFVVAASKLPIKNNIVPSLQVKSKLHSSLLNYKFVI